MALLSKIGANITDEAVRLPNRFRGGIMPMGAVTRKPRANSTEEIISSFRAHADSYEKSAQNAENELINIANTVGLDLRKEAKKLGVSIFDVAKVKNTPHYYTSEGDAVNLISISEDLARRKTVCTSNSKDIRTFLAQVKDIDPKHLGVAHDILDLGNIQELLNTNINLQTLLKNGKTVMGDLLSKFPAISRRSPGAIELTESVINNSDTTNAKYFIQQLFGNDLDIMSMVSEQMKAAKDIVPTIAKQTLGGGYLMDYSKENEFFNFLASFLRTDAKPENINLLGKILKAIENISHKSSPSVDGIDIALGDTKTIQENMKLMPQVLQNAETSGQNIDLSGFLTKNINLD